MNESAVSGNAAPLSPTDRARRFREKLKKDCARIDVTIGADTAVKLKATAERRHVPIWVIVEEAIEKLCNYE